ncbi:MAG TPA: hypothetical protein VKA58_14705 [Propionibacteriaceae bacterium]|nr:hypothetical protein [Propionibacteriaceae bacterium]
MVRHQAGQGSTQPRFRRQWRQPEETVPISMMLPANANRSPMAISN